MTDEKKQLYHERQKLQLCALHSLNSLFQQDRFKKKDLDSIVNKYDKSWCWNEYSSAFTGNYDLTIILDALEVYGYTLRAIDPSEPFEKVNFKDCFGLLLNVPLERQFFDNIPLVRKFTKPGRHWLAIKSIDHENYYNFDSKLSHPQLIGNENKLIEHLDKLNRMQTYIYTVIRGTLADSSG